MNNQIIFVFIECPSLLDSMCVVTVNLQYSFEFLHIIGQSETVGLVMCIQLKTPKPKLLPVLCSPLEGSTLVIVWIVCCYRDLDLDQAVHPYMEHDVYLKYFEFLSKVTTVCLLSSLLFILVFSLFFLILPLWFNLPESWIKCKCNGNHL